MLKKDHEEVKEILGQLKETKDSASKKREELFQKLKVELVPHMKAEESTFYPPLMAKKESREDALEGMEEHHVSDMVLKELGDHAEGRGTMGSQDERVQGARGAPYQGRGD